jgi:hypothetical protein
LLQGIGADPIVVSMYGDIPPIPGVAVLSMVETDLEGSQNFAEPIVVKQPVR